MTARPEDRYADLLAAAVEPDPTGLVDYLDAVRGFLTRYVVFPSEHEATAVALWAAHSHLAERAETSPILAITSAEMRSGKTRVLDCLELLVPRPYRVVTPSEAVVFTVLSRRPRPTLLLDEADAIFGPRTSERYEGVRAIFNAGNRQGTPVLRVAMNGRQRIVESFDVFGPKAIAGIGNLPDTVADRAIAIRMKRRAPNEQVAKFRRRIATAEAAEIPALDPATVPDVPDVPVPEALNDRAADAWEPLLAIADAAGPEWAAAARQAALVIGAADEGQVSSGMRLLADARDVFDAQGAAHLATVDLLRELHEREDSPWAEWYGKPLTARGLARLLEPYGVRPMQQRIGGSEPVRGYFRSAFEDAWERYLPAPAPGTTATSGTATGDVPE